MRLLNAFGSMQLVNQTPLTLCLVLKITFVLENDWTKLLNRGWAQDRPPRRVKWNLWIHWRFGCGFHFRCSFDVGFNRGIAFETWVGPVGVEPVCVE